MLTAIMDGARRCAHSIRDVLTARDGNISVMFAVLAVPAIATVGLGVDLSRAYRIKSMTQNAVDAAALAGGRAAQSNAGSPLAAATSAATTYYNTLKPLDVVGSTIALAANGTNTEFTLTATSWVSTPFLSTLAKMFPKGKAVGAPSGCDTYYACLKITQSATASIAGGGNGGSNIEVSLMLDVTGSMGGTKLTTLKTAASDLVDIIIWADQSKYTSRMAIVPFAEYVNVGSDFYTAVTNKTLGSKKAPCVVDRTDKYAGTDAAPATGAWISGAGVKSCDPDEAIVPLTANTTTLKNKIKDLNASGGTAGALGTEWAWYLISPNWSSIWGTASAPGSYSDLTVLNSNGAPKLRKFAVLMTDGDYNFMGGDDESTSTVNSAALDLCSGMKTKGIEVFTVGFQVGKTAKKMLTNCATDTSHFYDASSNEALLAAFRDIALKISSLRLTQ